MPDQRVRRMQCFIECAPAFQLITLIVRCCPAAAELIRTNFSEMSVRRARISVNGRSASNHFLNLDIRGRQGVSEQGGCGLCRCGLCR